MKRLTTIIRREIMQLLSFKALLVGHIVQPIAWLVLFSAGMAAMVRYVHYDGAPIRYLDFIFPGLLAMQAYGQFTYSLSRVADEKRHGMFRTIMSSGVTPSEYVAGKLGTALVIVFLQISFITVVYLAILGGRILSSVHLVWMLVLVSLGSVVWASLGVLAGTFLCSAEKSSVTTGLLGLPIMFSSSVFYDISSFSPAFRLLAKVNPLSYLAASVRDVHIAGQLNPSSIVLFVLLSAICVGLCLPVIGRTELITHEK